MSGRTEQGGGGRWAEGLPVALLCVLGGLTAWKIMSYATGQDPRIYLHFAEIIRQAGYSFESIAHCTRWVVPGYPLLLAGVLDTLGIFAAYWINLPIFCAGMWLLARVLRRFASPAETLVAMLVFFWIAVTGHPLNPHFLFLPFRGVLEWAWMFGALALWLPAADPALAAGRRARRAAGTALWLMAGAVFRETIVFLVVPFGLIGLWQGVRGDRGAWKALAALLAPLVLAALGLVAWKWLQQEPLLNSQARMWLKGLKLGGFAKPFPVLLEDIVRLIATELGVVGGIGLAAGTGWAFVRREKTVFALWATALLLVLFYAVYKSHVRYTLSAVGLLALVAGWGLAVTLSALARRSGPAGRRALFAGAALVFTGLTLRAVAGMETWGPRVTRTDVRTLQAHPAAAAPVVFIEKERRYMVDALLAFTAAAPRDPVLEGAAVRECAGALFLEPADDHGAFGAPQGVRSGDWLRQHFDFEPVEPDLVFGDARFRVFRMRSPAQTAVSASLEVDSAALGTLWLDFHSGNPSGQVELAIYEDKTLIFSRKIPQPEGFVPIRVPRGTSGAGKRVLTVNASSGRPILRDLSPVFTPDGQTRWFTMERGRAPSLEAWKGDGFERRALKDKHGACVKSNAVLALPAPVGSQEFEVICEISVNLRPHPVSNADISGKMGIWGASDGLVSWKIPSGRANRVVKWVQTAPKDEKRLFLGLFLENWPENGHYLRVEDVGIAFLE